MTNKRFRGVSAKQRRWAFGILFALLAAAALTPTTAQDRRPGSGFGVRRTEPGAQKRLRQVDWEPGKRLTDMLRADDQVLEVVDRRPDPLPPPDPPPGYPGHGKPYVQRLTEARSLIVLVRVLSQRGALNLHGDWVENTVNAEVLEVLKNSSPTPVRAGDSINLLARGGEVPVGIKTVRVTQDGTEPVETGRTYVVFAGPPNEKGFTTFAGDWLLDYGETLAPITRFGHAKFGPTIEKASFLNEVIAYSVGQQ